MHPKRIQKLSGAEISLKLLSHQVPIFATKVRSFLSKMRKLSSNGTGTTLRIKTRR